VHESLQEYGGALPPTVEIVTEHQQQSTACLAWDHFDGECAESLGGGGGGGSGSGEALAQVAAFGGDIGRLRTIFSYVEDHELARDDLDGAISLTFCLLLPVFCSLSLTARLIFGEKCFRLRRICVRAR
jgi:hypothetical protein